MEDVGGLEANISLQDKQCQIVENYKRVYLPLTYSIVFVLGLPLNSVVLWLSWCRTKRWTCTTIYLSNLMVADLLHIATLPFLIINYSLRDRWPFGNFFCRLVRFLFYTNLYGSILLLTCISVHRFLGVCYPIQSLAYRTRRLALTGTGTTWALVILQVLPTLVFSEMGPKNDHMVCYDLSRPNVFGYFFVYGMILTFSGFVLPFLIILICYSLMIKSLVKPMEAQTGLGTAARAKSVRTILVVCSLFALCFGPFHVTRFIYFLARFYATKNCPLLNVTSMAYKVWRPLVSFNTCLNPVLFFLSGGSNRIRLAQELRRNK
ncbi:P2Y purinoceptor 3-like [Phascolarctos cinereus]|uniref:P2Y purinoceptor 3-like n=1 Tax=Phascolarctos cinereus TaxID=38626 RepID=A0A6P5KI78_PHACI|nr:P2Y purinoceptor 3-like [Phascolarctos cinereus]